MTQRIIDLVDPREASRLRDRLRGLRRVRRPAKDRAQQKIVTAAAALLRTA